MSDPFDGWIRLMRSSVSMGQTGLRAMETLGAARQVVAARMPIINAALLSPLTSDHEELARLVPEKVEAFSSAGSATVSAWWAAQSAWMGHLQHVGTMAMRGRGPTPRELLDLSERTANLALETVEASARLGKAALAPVHGKATANARRLSTRGKNPPRG